MLRKKFVVCDRKNYYLFNAIFDVMNIIFVWFIYSQGYLGEVTMDFGNMLSSFLIDSFFNPIDLLFIIVIGLILLVSFLKRLKKRGKFETTVTIEIFTYLLIFVPIIIFLTGAEIWLYLNSALSAWLIAFIMLFNHMFIFHCFYVLFIYRYTDSLTWKKTKMD